jgi:hypothetical protein
VQTGRTISTFRKKILLKIFRAEELAWQARKQQDVEENILQIICKFPPDDRRHIPDDSTYTVIHFTDISFSA